MEGNQVTVLATTSVMVAGDELLREETMEGAKPSKCLVLKGTCYGRQVYALVDTGSSISAISEELCEELKRDGQELVELPTRKLRVVMANRKAASTTGRQVWLEFCVEGLTIEVAAIVVRGLVREIIIGMDALRAYQAVVDVSTGVITLRLRGCIGGGLVVAEDDEAAVDGDEVQASMEEVLQGVERAVEGVVDKENGPEEIRQLLERFVDVFHESSEAVRGYKFRLEISDATPFVTKQYPIPYAHRAQVRQLIAEMEQKGIIKRAITPYVSPLVVVAKKNGSIRICLDARKLNAVTIPRYEAPPTINDMIVKLGGAAIFSALDFSSAYWQIAVESGSQKYISFRFEGTVYSFTRLPFGLKNSGAALIRYLDDVIPAELKETLITYVDDIVLFSPDLKAHLRDLRQLFEIFRTYNLKLNIEKCKFCQLKVQFMGHEISGEGIEIQECKKEMIRKLPPPKNIRGLRRLFGILNYYSRFVKNYSQKVVPLLHLLRKGNRWNWTQQCQEAYEQLLRAFEETYVVRYPDFRRRMYLQTDSSGSALGAVLFQVGDYGQQQIIALDSRSLKGSEANFGTTESEALAVVWATRKFRALLVGRPFTVITDHKALIFLMRSHTHNEKLLRWALWLQQFQIDIEYCEGKKNLLPDYLSRIRVEEKEGEQNLVAIIRVSEIDPRWTKHAVIAMQQGDPFTREVTKLVAGQQYDSSKFKSVRERNAALWKSHDGIILRKTNGPDNQFRIWVPEKQRKGLIISTHEHYGHFGEKRSRVFWRIIVIGRIWGSKYVN